jgi:hypothetical protein
MNIVLTCLKNFQEYILINIRQLIKLGHKSIYVITNSNLFSYFDEFKSQIIIINADELLDSYNFDSVSNLDNKFREGFWKLTSQRFFIIYEFMKKYDTTNVIHLENDVIIYYNCDELEKSIDKNYMYIPFDSYKRNIASIVYIPDSKVFKEILDKYNFNKNDMENFAIIREQTQLIKNFPIFKKEYCCNPEESFVSQNSELFPFIFDAAAIGQYLGGVDPRNISGNTEGFVNETCVIKYNKYSFYFKVINGIKKPFITINNNEFPIFNLHIHCKNLIKFY